MGKLANRINDMYSHVVDANYLEFVSDFIDNIDKLYNICADVCDNENIKRTRRTSIPEFSDMVDTCYTIEFANGGSVQLFQYTDGIYLSVTLYADGYKFTIGGDPDKYKDSIRPSYEPAIPPEKVYNVYLVLKEAYTIIDNLYEAKRGR